MATKQKAGSPLVDEYIAAQPVEKRAALELLRKTIRKAAPEAEEVLSYQMPAYKFHGMLVYFAAHPHHYGLYALPRATEAFRKRLEPFHSGKGTLRFPVDKPIPVKLVTEIIQFRVKENLEKVLLKKTARKKKAAK